ncbi:MAG: LLM class flavin-dependent oxidoreductase [Candidatus Thorarchaeota archaeon]|jgi:alkanesulfonate monooxygenase SsuD/methylene tetrahydromethanopterin reductase-like flavin-dependent oxidoreductase (luciferase family)
MTDKLKHGLLFPNGGQNLGPAELADVAVEAEKAGWDGFFIWDNLVNLDPTVSLTAIGLKTKKMKFGTMVTAVARRRPWKLARETVGLDHLSNGRLIFGAGLGDETAYDPYGEDSNSVVRAQKLDEGLDILNGLWSGEKFSYNGKHYQIKEVQSRSTPMQKPRIPIWIGGLWPNKGPFRRASRWDGIMPHTVRSVQLGEQLTHQEVKDLMSYIEKHRKGSMDDFSLVMLSSTPDKDHADEIISPFVEIGAKWWCESVFEWQIPLDDAITRIKMGPPSI